MNKINSIENIIEIKTEPRSCLCCEENDYELMWASENIVVRNENTWKFPVNISICRNCGFCFSTPGPNSDDLEKYHEDGYVGFKGIGLPYSIKERLRILKKYKVLNGTFLEIGGDGPGEFHQQCSEFFKTIISIEITQDFKNKSININTLKDKIDVLVHYDVLEHVLNVKQFLLDCYDALKEDGIMICEVPNLKLYPENLLLQEFEHVNHFTISSLSLIAGRIGFDLVEFDEICSRPYGFVAVFKKSNNTKAYYKKNYNEFNEAREAIIGGLNQIRNNDTQLIDVRNKINHLTQLNKKVVLWGVTDLLRSLLKGIKITDNIIIVDSDPRRKDDLIIDGIKVIEPIKCIKTFLNTDLLVICAPRYVSEILAWIENEAGKVFNNESLSVIGINSSGKTLR